MKVTRHLDPATGDFSVTSSRRYLRASHPLQNKLALAYLVPLGTWEGDPAIGHRLRELARAKDGPGTRQRVRDLLEQAGAWLLEEGAAARLEFTVEQAVRGRVVFEVHAWPPDGGEAVSVVSFVQLAT